MVVGLCVILGPGRVGKEAVLIAVRNAKFDQMPTQRVLSLWRSRAITPFSATMTKDKWTTRLLGSSVNWQTRIRQNPDTTGMIAPTRICPNSGTTSTPMPGTCGHTWRERCTPSKQHLGSKNSRQHSCERPLLARLRTGSDWPKVDVQYLRNAA